MAQARSNGFSPAWRETLEELKLDDLLGERLRERIQTIFLRNEITASAAADEIAPIAARVTELAAALERVQLGFEFLAIGAEDLAPGEFEIGFLIPRPAVHEDLDELGREFVKLSRILGPFLELSTGTREPVRIRSIASSAFEAFLQSAPATALILATAIERLISSYEKVMTIRLAHQKLKEAGASQKTLESAEADGEAAMERDIEVLVEELLAEASGLERGRANELRKELEESLNALANRIDRGYTVEVRAGELPPPEQDEELSDEEQATRSAAHAVLSKQEAQIREPVWAADPHAARVCQGPVSFGESLNQQPSHTLAMRIRASAKPTACRPRTGAGSGALRSSRSAMPKRLPQNAVPTAVRLLEMIGELLPWRRIPPTIRCA